MASSYRPTNLENRFNQDLMPTPEELKDLLTQCRHPLTSVREKALLRLLNPSLSNEIAYYRRLILQVHGCGVKIKDLPKEWLEMVCEIYAFLDGVPASSSLYAPFARIIRHLPESSRRRLGGKSYSLQPFLPHLSADFFRGRNRPLPLQAKRRLRILKRLLIELCRRDPCCEPTLADLQPVWAMKGERRRTKRCKEYGRWRVVGRTLLLPRDNRTLCTDTDSVAVRRNADSLSGAGKAGRLQQNGYISLLNKGALRYLEKLLLRQAKELASVRDLAMQVSRKTRRIVLSLHNASLAAMGGWAFEQLAGQFLSTAQWRSFRQNVQHRLQAQETSARSNDPTAMQQLSELWERRLIHPKLAHILWESRIRALFEATKAPTFEKSRRICAKLLESALVEQSTRGEKYCWHGAVSPHQRLEMDPVLRQRRRHRREWRSGMLLLMAMIQEGQRLLEEDQLPHLVLPWIDKFFISSRRDEDLLFLPLLVNWITGQDPKPLILLWEDTSHARAPSLQLALDKLLRQGFPCRGIGVFDSRLSSRCEALRIICEQHRDILFFALRPYSDAHYRKSFFQLLREKDHNFLACYDSAWKDELAFVYTGTQVMSLLSVSCEMEPFPGWVAVAGQKQPFGRWLRQVLRTMVLGANGVSSDPFSLLFSRWANLC